MTRPLVGITTALLLALAAASPAAAQAQPAPRRPAGSRSIQIGGYAMVGKITFVAKDSFDTILGATSGVIFGGGATVGLPVGGLFVDIGGWRFTDDGERALVINNEVIPLGIPVKVTIIPIEISAGWKFRIRRMPKLLPYVAGGYTSYGYRETSSFSTVSEDVDDRFPGYHLRGGAEFKVWRWLGVAGEAAWTTVPDAIGKSGVSDAFNETNLGGTSFRLRITAGR